MSEIKITDNFLPEKEFNYIQETMMSAWIAWYYNDHVAVKEEDHLINNFQFTHNFFINHERSNQYDLIEPLLNKINPTGLVRVKANLGTRTEEHVEHGFHVDYDVPSLTTSIFYINTNNGFTKFVNGKKVESVANRYVEFNGQELHTGVSQTNTKARVVINFNYI
jgi:hypothetical protein